MTTILFVDWMIGLAAVLLLLIAIPMKSERTSKLSWSAFTLCFVDVVLSGYNLYRYMN